MQQPPEHVVAAYERRDGIVPGEVDAEREEPPGAVVDRIAFALGNEEVAPVFEVGPLTDRAVGIERRAEVPSSRLEQLVRCVAVEHRAGDAQIRAAREREHLEGSEHDLGVEVHVVVHEQHMGHVTRAAKVHQPAREAARTTGVGIGEHRDQVAGDVAQVEIAAVVDDDHVDAVGQLGNLAERTYQVVDVRSNVQRAVERGDHHAVPSVADRWVGGAPLATVDPSGAVEARDAHERRSAP